MSRPTLKLARPQPRIPYALLRKAVALFRSEYVSREIRRRNARKWLEAMDRLGDNHVYRGGTVRWGINQGGRA